MSSLTPGVTARILAPKLSALLQQSVIVDNRPGAGGTVGSEQVVKSAADGYTLLLAGRGPIVAAPLSYPNLPYAPGKDLAPVTRAVALIPGRCFDSTFAMPPPIG